MMSYAAVRGFNRPAGLSAHPVGLNHSMVLL